MNQDQENFEALRKLMALKKYEKPPPRYFTDLPGQIWNRIEREPAQNSFWERFFPNIGINPAFAYTFGLLACGSLVFGIGYSLRTETAEVVTRPIANDNWRFAPKLATTDGAGLNLSNFQPTQLASTNPVMNSLPSLFEGMSLRVAPVNYSPGQ